VLSAGQFWEPRSSLVSGCIAADISYSASYTSRASLAPSSPSVCGVWSPGWVKAISAEKPAEQVEVRHHLGKLAFVCVVLGPPSVCTSSTVSWTAVLRLYASSSSSTSSQLSVARPENSLNVKADNKNLNKKPVQIAPKTARCCDQFE